MATSGSFNTTSYDGRYYTLSWKATQSIENNTSTIAWTLTANGGNSGWYAERTVKVVIAGETVYSKTDRVTRYKGTVAIGSKTVSHDTYGEKSFTASVQAAVYTSSVNCTGSGSFDLDPIPRKSSLSLSASEIEMGKAVTLTIEKVSSNFTDNLWYDIGNGWVWVADNVTSGYQWKVPIAFADRIPNDTSLSVKLAIDTYNGDTFIGTAIKTFTANVPDYSPTFSVGFSDAMGYEEVYGVYVQSKSKLKIEVKGTGGYSSTVNSYKITFDGKTYTSNSITTDILKNSGSLPVNITITDTRGKTATGSKSIGIIAYTPPAISSMNVARYKLNDEGIYELNNSGDYLGVKFSAGITPLNSKNTASYKVEYKKVTETEYSEPITLTDYANQYSVVDGVYYFIADKLSSYNITLTATDAFDNAPKTGIGTSIKKRFSMLKKVFGFAIGKIAELEGVFDIALQTRFTGGILQPVLEPNTDFNDVIIPNTYTLKNTSTANYSNCPLPDGTTGTLTIETSGNEGQIRQIVTNCSKVNPVRYERAFFYDNWGEWICTSAFEGKLLWSGGMWMNAEHTIALAEKVSEQPNGIVLVFSAYYQDDARDWAFNHCFVSKYAVNNYSGKGSSFWLTNTTDNFATKYLYISDTEIKGHADNDTPITKNGITYNNNYFVLRYVIGV